MLRISLIAAGVMLLLSTQAMGAVDEARNTITVNGYANVHAKPDVAYITLYVKSGGILMTDAANKAAQTAADLEKTLREKHKQISDIAITSVSVGSKQGDFSFSDQKNESPSPEVTKRITLPPDQELIYGVLDTGIRAGAIMQNQTSIRFEGDMNSIVVYSHKDSTEFENQARAKALEDARQNAEKTATLIGRKVGEIVSVGSMNNTSWPAEFLMMGRQADLPAKFTSVDPSSVDVPCMLTITYELLK